MPCAHEPCTCVTGSDGYCSDHCRALAVENAAVVPVGAASLPLSDCGCGHPECVGTHQAVAER